MEKKNIRKYNENMNEISKVKSIVHKIIIYAYLPLTIALSIFTALGNIYSLGRIDLVTGLDYINLALLLLPFITAVLYIVSLVALMGKFKYGVKITLFSTALRTLIMLVVMYGFLHNGNTPRAFHYVFECVVTMLIWVFYCRNGEELLSL